MSKLTRADFITASLNRKAADAQEVLATFQANVAKDPAYALAWGDAAFKAAATIKVCEYALGAATNVMIEDGCDLEGAYDKVASMILGCILRNAACPASSSSQCSNIMETQMNAARAAVVELMDYQA